MEIAIVARLFTEGNVDVDACHGCKNRYSQRAFPNAALKCGL